MKSLQALRKQLVRAANVLDTRPRCGHAWQAVRLNLFVEGYIIAECLTCLSSWTQADGPYFFFDLL